GETSFVLPAFKINETGERILRAVGGGSRRRRAGAAVRDLKRLHTVAAITRRRVADTARRFGKPVEQLGVSRDTQDGRGEGCPAENGFGEEILLTRFRFARHGKGGHGGIPRRI